MASPAASQTETSAMTRSPCAAIRMNHLVELMKASNGAWSRVDRLRNINERVTELTMEAERAQSALEDEASQFRTDVDALSLDIDKMLRNTDHFTNALDKKREILRAHLQSNSKLYTVFKLLSVTSAHMVSAEACRLQCEFYWSYKPDQKEPTESQVKLEEHLIALHEAAANTHPNLATARAIKDVCTMIHDCFAERRDHFEELCGCVEKQMDYFAQKRDEEFTRLMERRSRLQQNRRARRTEIRRHRSEALDSIRGLSDEACEIVDKIPKLFETMTELIPQLCIFRKEELAAQAG